MFWFIFIASIYLTILVLVSVFRQKASPAERRVALVIGNEAYESEPLTKPVKDADAIAGALKRLGFKVVKQHNLRVTEMRDALAKFKNESKDAAWSLIYFSGHGLELNGENWLLPIGYKSTTKRAEVPDQAVLVERVVKRPTGARGLRLVILDACRDNPFGTRLMMYEGILRVTHGLAAMKPAYGEIVFFAARHGTKSYEPEDESGHSLFTEALLQHIEVEGLELGQFFRKVTHSVLEAIKASKEIDPATGEPLTQEPFLYGHIPDEDFYFKPPRRSR